MSGSDTTQLCQIKKIKENLKLARENCNLMPVDDYINQIYNCLKDTNPEKNLENFNTSEGELRQFFRRGRLARAIDISNRIKKKVETENVIPELKDFEKFIDEDHIDLKETGISKNDLKKLYRKSHVFEGNDILDFAWKNEDKKDLFVYQIYNLTKLINKENINLDEFKFGEKEIKRILEIAYNYSILMIKTEIHKTKIIPNFYVSAAQSILKSNSKLFSIVLWIIEIIGNVQKRLTPRQLFAELSEPFYYIPTKKSEFEMYSHCDEETFFNGNNALLEVIRKIQKRGQS